LNLPAEGFRLSLIALLRLAASVFAEVIGTAHAFDVLVHLVFEERNAAAGSPEPV
jgi:hypothetical protein